MFFDRKVAISAGQPYACLLYFRTSVAYREIIGPNRHGSPDLTSGPQRLATPLVRGTSCVPVPDARLRNHPLCDGRKR